MVTKGTFVPNYFQFGPILLAKKYFKPFTTCLYTVHKVFQSFFKQYWKRFTAEHLWQFFSNLAQTFEQEDFKKINDMHTMYTRKASHVSHDWNNFNNLGRRSPKNICANYYQKGSVALNRKKFKGVNFSVIISFPYTDAF